MPTFKDVDPRELRLLPSRDSGVLMWKYHRQVSKFGSSTVGMPPILVHEATDGVLVVYDGITRATRIAKLAPGTLVPVEIAGRLKRAFANDPKIGDRLP